MDLLHPHKVVQSSFPILWLLLSLHSSSMAATAWYLTRDSRTIHRIQQGGKPNVLPSCDVFSGSWVYDSSYPLYSSSDCPYIDSTFGCSRRPDADYLKYRWQPSAAGCQLPRFNGLEFLNRMAGKKVMFVGDSLSRNQWESLVCMISASVPKPQIQVAGGDPLSVANFPEYKVQISYYKAVYLVDIDMYQGKNYLKLDDIRGNGNSWGDADVLSFNTGHWYFHSRVTRGWDMVEYGVNQVNDVDGMEALERGLRTWASWVDHNVDSSRTKVFFQAISPTHYGADQWNIGPQMTTTESCVGQTGPSAAYPNTFPDPVEDVIEKVIKGMKSPPLLLNITGLSAMRKDAHPSIYGGKGESGGADCSHWCLPGLPDTWNLLFNYMLSL